MSNIYNRGLEYQILPSGKRVLQYPTGNTVPQYALVGNLKPNLDWKTNRMIQPLTQTKEPMKEPPFVPKNPVRANNLGGRKPYDIDYIIPPRKPKPSTGLLWEPNTIREMRQNVYPDGLPKNNIPVQSADSSYLEQKNNLVEMKRLEEEIKLARPDRGDLKELENQLEERQYKANPYKNVALSVEGHRQMAEREAKAIQDELKQLRRDAGVHKDDIVSTLQTGIPTGKKPSPLPPSYFSTPIKPPPTMASISPELTKLIFSTPYEDFQVVDEKTGGLIKDGETNFKKLQNIVDIYEKDPKIIETELTNNKERTIFYQRILTGYLLNENKSLSAKDLEKYSISIMNDIKKKGKVDLKNIKNDFDDWKKAQSKADLDKTIYRVDIITPKKGAKAPASPMGFITPVKRKGSV